MPADARCVYCARHLPAGTRARRARFPSTFVDWWHLRGDARRAWACLPCDHVAHDRTCLGRYRRGILARDGLWALRGANDLAWLILSPPEPPFAVWCSGAKSAHMIWRAPVTASRDAILFLWEQTVIRIHRLTVLSAWDDLQAWRELTGRPRGTPVRLSRRGISDIEPGLGERLVSKETLGGDPRLEAIVERLSRLGTGDLIALSCLSVVDGRPETPPRHAPAAPPEAGGRADAASS